MGVFERFRLFEKAELAFEHRLQENPFYPFHEIRGESELNNSSLTLPGKQMK